MSNIKFIFALWFMLNGVWPTVPYNIHSEEGFSSAEVADIAVHLFGLVAVCWWLYERYAESS